LAANFSICVSIYWSNSVKKQRVIFLYCSTDAQKGVVKTLSSHLRLLSRMPEPGTEVSWEMVDLDSPDFHLNEAVIAGWKTVPTVLVLAVTPQVLFNDEAIGAGMSVLLAALDRTSLVMLPIYCEVVPNPQRTPWARLCWFPNNAKDDYQIISRLGGVDSGASQAAVSVGAVLNRMAQAANLVAQPGAHKAEGVAVVTEPDVSLVPNNGAGRHMNLEDVKIPSLAILVAENEDNGVRKALEPILATLKQHRNVRSYVCWDVSAGADWQHRRALGVRASTVVVVLSAQALADDFINKQILHFEPEQRVIFFVHNYCLWEILSLERLNHQLLPVKGDEVVPAAAMRSADAWQQLASQLLKVFPKALPEENVEVLTAAEASLVDAMVQKSLRSSGHTFQLLTAADLTRAYYEK
jgi:hypothetical protein